MKNTSLIIIILGILCGCNFQKNTDLNGDSQYQSYAPDGISFIVTDSAWKADGMGNHRAKVLVKEKSSVVLAELPWRRPDQNPESKKVRIFNADSGKEVENIHIININSEKGQILFEPTMGVGTYYIYYLPYKYRKGWNDARYGKPWNDYLEPIYNTNPEWIKKAKTIGNYSKAEVICFESRSKFDFFTPMGIIATQNETDSLRKNHTENPVIFMEDRAFPIRLTQNLPVRWAKYDFQERFRGNAMCNEYYVWQLGVWAAHKELKNIKLAFSDLMNGSNRISKNEITCFNLEGINWDGKPIRFNVNLDKNKIQALWCGVQIPKEAKPGVYKGEITFSSLNGDTQIIPIEINVNKQLLADSGDGDLWRHARLRWLNSRIGEDNLPVSPYENMHIDNRNINATDKKVTINSNGLPEQITINGKEVLSVPMRFVVNTTDGDIEFEADNVSIKKIDEGLVSWTASSEQNNFKFICKASMEFDGYIHYNINVSSPGNLKVNNIQLITNYSPSASTYFMGCGFKGGNRPLSYKWNWEGPWDSYWMGSEKAGLHVEFRGGSYHGPLLNDYKPAPPKTWANNGKGNISVTSGQHGDASVIANCGKDTIFSSGNNYEFALLITPVKKVNPAKHFSERYYHSSPEGFDKAAEEGPNIINIHHARSLNPVINYPFIVRDSLINFIQHQHNQDRKVKLYYTIRELSNYVAEVYALKSLNHEIFASGPGFGIPWHMEHLIEDYKPAWYTELPGETSDAALVLTSFSRWINYYLEGLRWMFENYQIDGIYMDDVSFDRNVMKRMRKIMEKYRPGSLVDLHSNTWYSVGPANQYTDFFPYIDRLWFGESFKYNEMTPDEWLVTFSGIPFGQMSEMLQDGGNPFLGMVYGTTARHSYGKHSPAPVWQVWKSFEIEKSKMIGYWDEACPVKTNHPLVKATAYVKDNQVLIAIGNFDKTDRDIRLSVDWDMLKLGASNTVLSAPQIADFQDSTYFSIDKPIPVKSKKGWLLILSNK